MEKSARPIISAAVLSQEVNGDTVLLDLQGEGYFGLNHVGSRIWQLLEKECCLEDILEVLEDEFDAPRAQLEADVGELLNRLSNAGIITFP
jgi:hypothetical protein